MRKKVRDLGQISSIIKEIEGVIEKFERLDITSSDIKKKTQTTELKSQLEKLQFQIKSLS